MRACAKLPLHQQDDRLPSGSRPENHPHGRVRRVVLEAVHFALGDEQQVAVNDGHPASRSVLAPRRRRGAAKCMEIRHGNHRQRGSSRAVEQRQDRCSGGPRRVPWRPGGNARHRHAAQDPAPSAVRDHAGDPGRLAGLDAAGWAEVRGLPIPEPASRLTPSGHSTVRPHPRASGESSSSRSTNAYRNSRPSCSRWIVCRSPGALYMLCLASREARCCKGPHNIEQRKNSY